MLGSLISPLAQSDNSGGGGIQLLLFFLLMGGALYFLMIRPQQRRTRAQRSLIQSLEVGDQVVTIGGMFGTIRALDDESLTVEVSPGVEIKFARGAIARKLVYDEGSGGDDSYESADAYGDASSDTDSDADDQVDGDGAGGTSGARQGPWFGRAQRRKRGGEAGKSS